MTKLIVNNIDSYTTKTDFLDPISANYDQQWLDSFGIIKTNRPTIDESITIPSGTNGISVGSISVGTGKTITIQGEWRII